MRCSIDFPCAYFAARLPRPARPAFTLVEILVVVVILGIIAAVVGVSLGSRDDLRVQSSVRVLMADLQYAQSRAVVRRQPHYVIVGSSGSSLTISTRGTGVWETLTHPVEHKPFQMVFGLGGSGGGADVTLAAHDFQGNAVFGFDETGAPIYCDADGNNRVDAAAAATFTLSSGTYQMVVRVEPITGEISAN